MSKNQKPARKQQAEKEIKAIPIPAEERGCKCETAKEIFKMEPEYDDLMADNKLLQKNIELLGCKNVTLHEKNVTLLEENRKLESDVKTLQSMLKKRDERIESLESNVEFYRTRGVWKTILYKWFGC